MPRIYIETYGCQMNVSDSELMFGVLGREGYVRTDDPAQADVLLVNPCAVRDHAEQKVLSRLGELKEYKRPGDVLGVVGCMAQRLGARLLERGPQVDLVIGPDGYRGLPELIARARAGERAAAVEFKSWEHYEDVPPVRGTPVSAFVTVQRGCDYRCTFCIVPMTRGPERSRKLEDVVREVERLTAGGTTEVTLLGQTVNSYWDGEHDFADLLRAVGRVPGLARLRFTSPYPTDFSDRVLCAMAETPTVCEHVHLPVQSGSSRVLRRMLRRDRKSTRLNSSHGYISYAVFCLKKKNMARIQRGKLRLFKQPVDIGELVAHVVQMCEIELRAKRIQLRQQMVGACDVDADPARLQ